MRTLIFVAGMGRSGTSSLARLLSMCGAVLPRKLLGPSTSNPSGHWEPLVALNLNDAFLAANRSSWWDPSLRLQVDSTLSLERREQLAKKITKFLERELGKGDLVVIKEPRIPALFDHWLAAARRSGFMCKVIHIYRHPEEVASSLHARDQLTKEHSYLLWIKYNLLSERYARDCPRAFISYDDLLRNWHHSVRQLNETLALNLDLPSPHATGEFVLPELRHHVVDTKTIDDPTPGLWVARVYAVLLAASGSVVDSKVMDRVFDEFVTWERPSWADVDWRSQQWPLWVPQFLKFVRSRRRPNQWHCRSLINTIER